MKIRTKKTSLMLPIGTLIIFVGVLANWQLFGAMPPPHGEEKSDPMLVVQQLFSNEKDVRDAAVNRILADRLSMVKQLCTMVAIENAKKYEPDVSVVSAYLLGELRASEAAPVLVPALENEPGPDFNLRIDRYNSPVSTALTKIGRPAVPALIETLKTSDSARLRTAAIHVLGHVLGGKQRSLEVLERLRIHEKDAQSAARLKTAMDWIIVNIKQPEPPPY